MTGRSASSGSDSMSLMPSLPWDPRPDSERGLKLTLRQAVGAEAKGHMRNYLGIERILWGTDFPHMLRQMSPKRTPWRSTGDSLPWHRSTGTHLPTST